jgi:hypothetical protein
MRMTQYVQNADFLIYTHGQKNKVVASSVITDLYLYRKDIPWKRKVIPEALVLQEYSSNGESVSLLLNFIFFFYHKDVWRE